MWAQLVFLFLYEKSALFFKVCEKKVDMLIRRRCKIDTNKLKTPWG